MKTPIDITGQKFGRLTVMVYTHSNKDKKACFDCQCECGNIANVSGKSLRNGNTKSCGCLRNERIKALNTTHGACSVGKTKMYFIWRAMICRCTNPKNKNFHQYGGRGITVCDEWLHDYARFLNDIGERPTDKHTLDRKENHLGYSKENCRWASMEEQQNNKRTNRLFIINGHQYTASQVAKTFQVEHIYQRLHRGWSIEKILNHK